MKDRDRHVVIKVDDTELAKLHAIAELQDEPIARAVRRWIDVTYRQHFGEKTPPKPKTRSARA